MLSSINKYCSGIEFLLNFFYTHFEEKAINFIKVESLYQLKSQAADNYRQQHKILNSILYIWHLYTYFIPFTCKSI